MTPYTHAEREKWFQRIVETHRGILYKVARMYCPLESDREDLIQEILLQIWQSAHRYNPQFNLSTWLYRIALNVAISFYRKNTVRQPDKMPIHEALTGMAAPESAPQEHQLQLLEQFIQELNHFDKALMLLYLEGKPQSDIAEILGISVSNVSTKVGRNARLSRIGRSPGLPKSIKARPVFRRTRSYVYILTVILPQA